MSKNGKPKYLSVSYIDYLGAEQIGTIIAYLDNDNSAKAYDPANPVIIGDDVLVFIQDVKEEHNKQIVTTSDGITRSFAECRRFNDVVLN